MWWKLTRSQFEQRKGEENKKALRQRVFAGEIPGLLVYAHGEAVGWCAVEPRNAFPTLERSRILKRVDDKPVWSVVCFFVARPYRRQGLSECLLQFAVEYAGSRGAQVVEGYPVASQKANYPDTFAYTGRDTVFRRVGFEEVARRSPTRPIMRYTIAHH
ncbi:MAG TPA: GNAT family N-acetyltransferase [Atribacteraceae bacterium]|nr:GNAT family N-acetyltransferase [Atribacteraceae bacterium]